MADTMKKPEKEINPPRMTHSSKIDDATREHTEEEDNELLKKNGGRGRGPGRGGMVREKPKDMGKTLKRLFSYIGRNKIYVIGLIIVMMIITLLNLVGPSLQGKAIDNIHDPSTGSLKTTLITMACLYLISAALTYFQGIFAANLSQKTVFVMRNDLFRKICYLPIKYTDTHQHGDIMSRMTNDVENISNTISQSIASLFSAVITLIGTIAIMVYYSPVLTLVAMISIPLTMVTSTLMAKVMRKYFVRQQRLLGSLNSQIEEMVTGYHTVVAYGHEDEAAAEFSEIAGSLKNTAIKANIFGGIMGPIMNCIGNIGFMLVAVVGGYLALNNLITIGVITAFIQYTRQLSRPINEIANQYTSILTAIAGAERVFDIIDADIESGKGKPDLDLSKVKGDLSFRHINFSYVPGEPVLKDFNLEVKAGQTIAIVGKTGSGKTTIVNLLTRFYDIDGGEILIDGVDIRKYSPHSIRKAIAIVLQDTVLFSDTISANIRYGRLEASDEEVRTAAATANASEFIERLPETYQTELSESGGNLSAGQRQLLSIARAVLADPNILILDEATSSVDTRTEMNIQSAMLKLMKNRTSLVIAHRLSTIRDADMIIVLADGKIAEHGNHEELLAQKGAYYDLYMTQFAGIET